MESQRSNRRWWLQHHCCWWCEGKRKYLSTNSGGTRVDLWIKDDNSGRQRWKLTGELVPTPKPTPKPTPVPVKNLVSGGGWKIVKGKKKCTISIENGVKHPCAVSPNYPKPYSADVKCEISMKKTTHVILKGSSEKYFDYLTVSGKHYSGSLSGKKLAVKGNVKWTADFFEATKGWKFCKGKKPHLKVVQKKKKKKYVLQKKKQKNKCPRGSKTVRSARECRAAAKEYGKGYNGYHEKKPFIGPFGCVYIPNKNKKYQLFYFNNCGKVKGGHKCKEKKYSSLAQKVCRKK